jgi:hypothetical protein
VGAGLLVLVVGGYFASGLLRETGEAHTDLSAADGSLWLGNHEVLVSVTPRPARAMEPLTFRFRLVEPGKGVVLPGARLSFRMKMDMGPHQHVLAAVDDDVAEARSVILPTCPSGGRVWFGDVSAESRAGPVQATFRIELAPGEK